ncbi:hypothetical protein Gotri_018857 [Gossypium trilobum]|uniref:RNase H type-1 domain-containing protein n=1 Tax=Gossypium trilobum TaxID=34281 RepID=A0A7J9EAY8_9ROSI|nr:hypothetical protein [Gossypium trilobum]
MADVKYHLAPSSIQVRIQGMELDGINQKLHVRRVETERWKLSESPYVKIYFDVTFQNHSNRSCTVIVIKNSNGVVLGSRMIMNDHIFLAFAAGALACFQAVQMDLGRLIRISAYIRSSISLSESYQSCFFGHAPKQGNKVAHLLAIEGIKRGVSTYLTQGMPFSAAIAVEKDWWWMDLPD